MKRSWYSDKELGPCWPTEALGRSHTTYWLTLCYKPRGAPSLDGTVSTINFVTAMREDVILVDALDRQIGVLEKLEAHKKGKLHRAVSVFIFHPDGRLLLQRRARTKYHSGGKWSNTCCSHPRPGEEVSAAAHRRLWEEMALECKLFELYAFRYRVTFKNGLTEHEYDHVFIGVSDEEPLPDPIEASNWKWISPDALRKAIRRRPSAYTYWLAISYEEVVQRFRERRAIPDTPIPIYLCNESTGHR